MMVTRPITCLADQERKVRMMYQVKCLFPVKQAGIFDDRGCHHSVSGSTCKSLGNAKAEELYAGRLVSVSPVNARQPLRQQVL